MELFLLLDNCWNLGGTFTDTPPHLGDLKNVQEIDNNIFQPGPNFSLWEWKENESKVAGEYCWAITIVTGCGRAATATEQVPLCWRVGFTWTVLFVRTLLCSWPHAFACPACYASSWTWLYSKSLSPSAQSSFIRGYGASTTYRLIYTANMTSVKH